MVALTDDWLQEVTALQVGSLHWTLQDSCIHQCCSRAAERVQEQIVPSHAKGRHVLTHQMGWIGEHETIPSVYWQVLLLNGIDCAVAGLACLGGYLLHFGFGIVRGLTGDTTRFLVLKPLSSGF